MSGSIQGSILWPVFFIMYIQDISREITVKMNIFVDDAKIKAVISEDKDLENCRGN